MDQMKGVGRMIMTSLDQACATVDLVRFGDGSLAVRVAGRTVSVWEVCEEDEGVRAFLGLIRFGRVRAPDDPPDALIFFARRSVQARSMN